MQDGAIHITGRAKTLSLSMALTLLLLLSVLSVRTFLGAYEYGKVPGILDDRSFEGSVAIIDVSEESLPAYENAMKTLEQAIFFDPSRAVYQKALSDISVRLGSWAETMELIKAPLPEGMVISKNSFDRAAVTIRESIRLQPTNPENHLAYGHLSREMKNIETARSEYEKAVNANPGSSALRYGVIMECLAAGMNADALAQAKELVRIDDSYKVPDSYAMRSAVERRTPYYLRKLSGSFLFKAFEVIWRTSNKDIAMLQSIVPDNDEARDAFELFLEAKGIAL